MRWLGAYPRRPMATQSEALDQLRSWHARERVVRPPLGFWAIVPLVPQVPPGPPVGTLLLMPDGPTGHVEIGWHLHPSHQGRGLATEAGQAVLSLAARAGIDQVMALTEPDNVASQRLAQRLGMLDEGDTDRWFGNVTRQYRIVLAAGSASSCQAD